MHYFEEYDLDSNYLKRVKSEEDKVAAKRLWIDKEGTSPYAPVIFKDDEGRFNYGN